MTKAADLALGKIAAVKTALIEFTDGDDAIAVADAGVVTLLTTAVAKSEGGAVTTNIAQGLIKSWTTHGSASIIDSFNTASITDIATGRQRINFTNNTSGVGYTIAGLVGNNNNSYSTTMNLQRPYYWQTSGYEIVTLYLSNTAADYSHTDTQVTGDLA